MIGKLLRALVVPAMALALATVPIPVSAEAAPSPHFQVKNSNQGRILCQLPYLSTGLGLIAQCSRTHLGGYVDFGFYSPHTRDFNTITEPRTISTYVPVNGGCLADDGYFGTCLGYPMVTAGIDEETRATQYDRSWGRWGWYRRPSGQYSPDGGWYLISHWEG